MRKVAIIFGTRPEIIKLYPVIKSLKPHFKVVTIFTGQHRDLGRQMLKMFKINPDYDLDVMLADQSLSLLTAALHEELYKVLEKEKPDLVIVQGDTTSALIGAMEAFYHKIPVAHIEAGLRTNNVYSPYPEEINRRLISQIATYNFPPTKRAEERLKRSKEEEESGEDKPINRLKSLASSEYNKEKLKEVIKKLANTSYYDLNIVFP